MDRRAFLGGAVVGGAVLGTGWFTPVGALRPAERDATPKPTTSIFSLEGLDFSLTFFGPGMDASTITDFNGFVGVADVRGTGTATNSDGSTETLLYDTDMRFMSGTYVAVDGAVHKGVFGFV